MHVFNESADLKLHCNYIRGSPSVLRRGKKNNTFMT